MRASSPRTSPRPVAIWSLLGREVLLARGAPGRRAPRGSAPPLLQRGGHGRIALGQRPGSWTWATRLARRRPRARPRRRRSADQHDGAPSHDEARPQHEHEQDGDQDHAAHDGEGVSQSSRMPSALRQASAYAPAPASGTARRRGRRPSSSSSCVPRSTMRPSSTTTITVGLAHRRQPVGDHDRRAPVQAPRRSAACTSASFSVSRWLVASSRMTTHGSFSSMRAMASRCFSPPDSR